MRSDRCAGSLYVARLPRAPIAVAEKSQGSPWGKAITNCPAADARRVRATPSLRIVTRSPGLKRTPRSVIGSRSASTKAGLVEVAGLIAAAVPVIASSRAAMVTNLTHTS